MHIMHRLLLASCIVAAFGAGYWLATASQSASPDVSWFADDEHLRDQILALQVAQGDQSPEETSDLLADVEGLAPDHLLALVQRLPDHEIDRQLRRVLRDSDLNDHIHDRRAFATRLVEEALKEFDPSTLLSGQAFMSSSREFPGFSTDVFEVEPRQTLFAHFDTYGVVPHDGQVFIRWKHRDTGRLLLFTQKNITADAHQNWVSFRPESAWKPGHYDVKYYQFNDHLAPIAQVGYVITRVLEPGASE
ncbi:hypothetical protein [Isoalcanivorax indicus]|uniref:hypothetical protein n=1 Tax=Isoalcanivorax indicus TaxID=2202653 RepID=UPI0013C4AE62|nr:hypothetical protein [Isoalcanivorax indicus]